MNRLLRRKLRRDLRRRRAQVIAVSLTVFVGIMVAVLTAGMASNLGDSYDLTYERTSFADAWISGGAPTLGTELWAIDGVDRVEIRTSGEIGVEFTDRPIRTRVQGVAVSTTLNQLVITEGRAVDPAGDGVVLEEHTADNFGLGPGDTITVSGFGPVEIVGVGASPEWLWVAPSQQELIVDLDEFGVVYAPEHLAATWLPESEQLVVAVQDHDPDVVDNVARAAILAGAGEVVTRDDHPSNQALKADLEGFEELALMFPVLFLFAAGLATAVLLSRLVTQQRPEIGMLRANGYGRGTIQRHYSWYGVVVALLGAIPAVPAGIYLGWLATDAYTGFLGIPFASRQVELTAPTVAVVASLVVGGLAGFASARRAVAIDPAEAMRPGGGSVAGKHSFLERALPRRAPNWMRMGVRNLHRAPGRSVTTALGIVLALLLTVTAFVLQDTVDNLFVVQFERTDLRGLVVEFDDGGDDLVTRIEAVDGVSVVEPHFEQGAALLTLDGIVAERLQVYAAGTRLHDFEAVGGLPTDGLIVSARAAGHLDVEVGDLVEMRAIDGTVGTFPVAGVIREPLAGSSYLSADAWESIGGSPPHSVAVGLVDRDRHDEVRDAVAEIEGITRITDQVATADRAKELLAASRFFVGLVLVLAVVMAVALIFNALTVTIGERETEVATLQANGVSRSWVRRAITAENLVNVSLGAVPGLVIGWVSAGVFVRSFSTEQFRFDPILRPTSVVWAVVLLGICALVAQIPGLRRLDRLDLAAKVRERAL